MLLAFFIRSNPTGAYLQGYKGLTLSELGYEVPGEECGRESNLFILVTGLCSSTGLRVIDAR